MEEIEMLLAVEAAKDLGKTIKDEDSAFALILGFYVGLASVRQNPDNERKKTVHFDVLLAVLSGSNNLSASDAKLLILETSKDFHKTLTVFDYLMEETLKRKKSEEN